MALMDTAWISIAMSAVVLLVQLTSRYHKDGAASEANLRKLEGVLTQEIAKIQIQLAKLPDEIMTRVGQNYVTNDRYVAEMEAIRVHLRHIEQSIKAQ